MQHRLPLDPPDTHPSDQQSLLSIYSPPDSTRRVTEIDRLRGELATVSAGLARIERVRHRLRARASKLTKRARSLSLQLESLERNPYAILRYQSSVPQQYQGDLWHNRPLSDVGLESVAGLGGERYRLLVERCPTVGDLEVLRVYEGLTVIPGIGRLVAARIEKKLFTWLMRNAWGYVPMASREHVGRERVAKCPREVRL